MTTLLEVKLNDQSSIEHACAMESRLQYILPPILAIYRFFHETGSDWVFFVSVASDTFVDMVFLTYFDPAFPL